MVALREVAGDRQRWADIPLEVKLGAILVPLAVALIGVGVPLLSGGDEGPDPSARKPKDPHLDVIDLASTAQGAVDLTLVNRGNLVAIVKGIGFRVGETVTLRKCPRQHPSRNPLGWRPSPYRRTAYQVFPRALEPSESYTLSLPARPRPGREVKHKVSQEIATGEPDRFIVRFAPPNDGLRLYRLEVLLYHDKGPRPKRLGEVLLSLPEVRIPGYLRRSASQSCTRANRSRLQGILEPDTVAPSKLANLLAAG